MNAVQAYQNFWQSFGINAYDETTVPPDATMPYITYMVIEGSFDESIYPSASIWYKGTSWEDVTQKAYQINDSIGYGGMIIPYENGAFWIKRGTPFMQRLSDTDSLVRRILLNLEVEFISE